MRSSCWRNKPKSTRLPLHWFWECPGCTGQGCGDWYFMIFFYVFFILKNMGIAGSRVTCCSPTSCLFFQLFGFYRQEWSFYRQTLGFEPHTLVLGRNAIFVGQITFLAGKSLNFCSFTWQLFIHCRMQSGQVLIWALVGTGVDMQPTSTQPSRRPWRMSPRRWSWVGWWVGHGSFCGCLGMIWGVKMMEDDYITL